LRQAFNAFLESTGTRNPPRNDAERELLFREFMSWREKR
jgi:hypothetical protein